MISTLTTFTGELYNAKDNITKPIKDITKNILGAGTSKVALMKKYEKLATTNITAPIIMTTTNPNNSNMGVTLLNQ